MTTNGSGAGHDERPRCGGSKRGGGTCTQAAGWGTPHPGVGRCKLHGGSTPTHVAAAQQQQAEEVLRSLIWNPQAAPVTDSVSEMRRLAGALAQAVDVVGGRLNHGEPCSVCGRGPLDLDSVTAAVWARAVREQRQLLAEMERLGIANRYQQMTEELAGQVAGDIEIVVRRILERLQLEERQLVLVPVVVPEELRRVMAEQVPGLPGPGAGS